MFHEADRLLNIQRPLSNHASIGLWAVSNAAYQRNCGDSLRTTQCYLLYCWVAKTRQQQNTSNEVSSAILKVQLQDLQQQFIPTNRDLQKLRTHAALWKWKRIQQCAQVAHIDASNWSLHVLSSTSALTGNMFCASCSILRERFRTGAQTHACILAVYVSVKFKFPERQ